MKKSLFMILSMLLVLPMVLFTGCGTDNSDQITNLQNQIATLEDENSDLQGEIADRTKYCELVYEEESLILVTEGTEVIVVVPDSSGYVYFNESSGVDSFSLSLKNYVEGEFVTSADINEEEYNTLGEGVYKLIVTEITGAETIQLEILLTATQR